MSKRSPDIQNRGLRIFEMSKRKKEVESSFGGGTKSTDNETSTRIETYMEGA